MFPTLSLSTSLSTARALLRGLALLALFGFTTAAFAQACERGALDERYCDENGDMLADTPENEADLLDPGTLVFTYAPTEDPAVYQDAFADFMAYLSELTGKDVQYFPVRSYAAQIEAMRAGRLHVSGFSAGSVEDAVNSAGFHPMAMMAADDGSFGYEMEIITPPDSDVESLEDLEGEQVALVSPTSNSGFKAPTALLYDELGLIPDEGYETAFSGGHDNSILGVVNGDYEAAAIASSVMRRMIDRDVLSMDDVEIIYTSQTFPSTGYGAVYNLEPELLEQVREAFLTFDWTGTALDEEFDDVNKWIEISYAEDWEVLRRIAAASASLE